MATRSRNSSLAPAPNKNAFRYYPALERVEQYVCGHLSQPITLDSAAREAHLERKYFSAYFRSKVGIRFRDWLRFLRVQRAKELMYVRDEPMTHVAFASGFKDQRSFERAFKRVAMMSPRAYKLSVRPDSRLVS